MIIIKIMIMNNNCEVQINVCSYAHQKFSIRVMQILFWKNNIGWYSNGKSAATVGETWDNLFMLIIYKYAVMY